jgi:hypothetical protein
MGCRTLVRASDGPIDTWCGSGLVWGLCAGEAAADYREREGMGAANGYAFPQHMAGNAIMAILQVRARLSSSRQEATCALCIWTARSQTVTGGVRGDATFHAGRRSVFLGCGGADFCYDGVYVCAELPGAAGAEQRDCRPSLVSSPQRRVTSIASGRRHENR